MERKVLVCVDETNYRANLLQYLAANFSGQAEFHFHLFSVVPCHLSGPSGEWLDDADLMSVIDTSTRKRFIDRKHQLQELAHNFIKRGFAEEQLSTSVRLGATGLIPTILLEARQGLYDAIVSGKRDLSTLEKLVLGSFSTEMLSKNRTIPLWLVSGTISSAKFLVAVDCSPHTLDAIDHLAFMLQDNPHAEITLFHSQALLSAEAIASKESFYAKWGKEWCDEHLAGEPDQGGHFHFHAAEQVLREGGFAMERVRRLNLEKGIEPAQMIVQQLKQESYGTIVMGRRGKGVSKGIFQGVSDRVLANVSDVAIWIIG